MKLIDSKHSERDARGMAVSRFPHRGRLAIGV
jgi:hypothetical protein